MISLSFSSIDFSASIFLYYYYNSAVTLIASGSMSYYFDFFNGEFLFFNISLQISDYTYIIDKSTLYYNNTLYIIIITLIIFTFLNGFRSIVLAKSK